MNYFFFDLPGFDLLVEVANNMRQENPSPHHFKRSPTEKTTIALRFPPGQMRDRADWVPENDEMGVNAMLYNAFKDTRRILVSFKVLQTNNGDCGCLFVSDADFYAFARALTRVNAREEDEATFML